MGVDSLSDEPGKSPRRESMNRARATLGLTASEMDDVPVPPFKTAGSDGQRESDVEVDKQYFGVGYHPNVVFTTVSLDRDAARERTLRMVWLLLGKSRCDELRASG